MQIQTNDSKMYLLTVIIHDDRLLPRLVDGKLQKMGKDIQVNECARTIIYQRITKYKSRCLDPGDNDQLKKLPKPNIYTTVFKQKNIGDDFPLIMARNVQGNCSKYQKTVPMSVLSICSLVGASIVGLSTAVFGLGGMLGLSGLRPAPSVVAGLLR